MSPVQLWKAEKRRASEPLPNVSFDLRLYIYICIKYKAWAVANSSYQRVQTQGWKNHENGPGKSERMVGERGKLSLYICCFGGTWCKWHWRKRPRCKRSRCKRPRRKRPCCSMQTTPAQTITLQTTPAQTITLQRTPKQTAICKRPRRKWICRKWHTHYCYRSFSKCNFQQSSNFPAIVLINHNWACDANDRLG